MAGSSRKANSVNGPNMFGYVMKVADLSFKTATFLTKAEAERYVTAPKPKPRRAKKTLTIGEVHADLSTHAPDLKKRLDGVDAGEIAVNKLPTFENRAAVRAFFGRS